MNKSTTIVTRRSPFTQKINRMEIPLSHLEFEKRTILWQSGMLIQDAFPMLSAGEREFIKTGITPKEWDEMFKDEE